MSIINKLTIENFKGIGQPVEFDFGRITLFFGQNSAGKSTILHALNYLHDVFNLHFINADSTSLGAGSIDLGGFSQFVHRHDLENEVRFTIDLDLSDLDLMESDAAMLYRELFEVRQTDVETKKLFDLAEMTSAVNSCSIGVAIVWSDLLKRPYVKQFDLLLNDEHILSTQSSSDCRRVEIFRFSTQHSLFKQLEGLEEHGKRIYTAYNEITKGQQKNAPDKK